MRGLHCGADDYVVKPLRRKELLARVKAAMRRSRMPAHNLHAPMRFGRNDELIIDPVHRQVLVRGKSMDMTRTEYDLLLYLAQHHGQMLAPSVILNNVWTNGADGSEDSVKWYIWRLCGARSRSIPKNRDTSSPNVASAIGLRPKPTMTIEDAKRPRGRGR